MVGLGFRDQTEIFLCIRGKHKPVTMVVAYWSFVLCCLLENMRQNFAYMKVKPFKHPSIIILATYKKLI
jgi:hypothetical protein